MKMSSEMTIIFIHLGCYICLLKKVVQENYVLDAYACCKCDRSATEEVVGYRLELLGNPGY